MRVIVYLVLVHACTRIKTETTNISNPGNTTNTTEAGQLNDSPSAPVMIAKTLISTSTSSNETCKDNPLVDLLPVDLASSVRDSLKTVPDFTVLDYCNNIADMNETCCTKDTMDILYNQFTGTDVPEKLQIYEKNLYLFGPIIGEHIRNLKVGFNVDSETTNKLFANLTSYISGLSDLARNLIKDSLTYKWNSYCNYICRPYASDYCNAYNVSYAYNNTVIYDLQYDCTVDSTYNDKMQSAAKSFYQNFSMINSTFEGLYGDIIKGVNSNVAIKSIITTVQAQLNISQEGDGINTTSGTGSVNSTSIFSLLQQSLKDGLAVNRETAQTPICNNTFQCEDILEKYCVPFNCFDSSFLQFKDDSTLNQSAIMEMGNFSKITLNNKTQLTLARYDGDVANYIEANLVFATIYGTWLTLRVWYILCSIVITYVL